MYEAKAASANKPGRFQFANSLLIKYYYSATKQIVKTAGGKETGEKRIKNKEREIRLNGYLRSLFVSRSSFRTIEDYSSD